MSEFITLTNLELSVLSVFVKQPADDIYGLEVLKLLNQGRQAYKLSEIPYGSFYPALKKLEKAKILISDWGAESDKAESGRTKSGARRRYYKITPLGLRTYEANQNYLDWVQADQQQLAPA